MKKSILSIATVLMILGCQQAATSEKGDTIPATKIAEYAVSKAEAFEANKNYVEYMTDSARRLTDPVRAFTVRSEDLLQLLNINSDALPSKNFHKHVRIYLGYEDNKVKLYFTPVEGARLSGDSISAGKDLYWDGPFEGVPVGKIADGNGEYLFDFTKPCPTTCPELEMQ